MNDVLFREKILQNINYELCAKLSFLLYENIYDSLAMHHVS